MNTAQVENIERKTLSEIVTNDFRVAVVFENYGLDFCCHGSKPLIDAASEKQIPTEIMLADLTIAFQTNDISALRKQHPLPSRNRDGRATSIVIKNAK